MTIDEIKKIIDFSKDYYSILDVEKNLLKNDRIHNAKILQQAYRKKIFEYHPDRFPESQRKFQEEKFKEIIRAHHILSDSSLKKVYDAGEWPTGVDLGGGNLVFSTVGKYEKGSFQSFVGVTLCKKICHQLKLKNSIRKEPKIEKEDDYLWEIDIEGLEPKYLSISIQDDESEILRLTSESSKVDKSLPFKIYIFIPSVSLFCDRAPDKYFYKTPDGIISHFEPLEQFGEPYYIQKGEILGSLSVDADLYSGTSLDDAIEFIKNLSLENSITDYINGDYRAFIPQIKKYIQINKSKIRR
jgi:curved DNA-binding protein CbpA